MVELTAMTTQRAKYVPKIRQELTRSIKLNDSWGAFLVSRGLGWIWNQESHRSKSCFNYFKYYHRASCDLTQQLLLPADMGFAALRIVD